MHVQGYTQGYSTHEPLILICSSKVKASLKELSGHTVLEDRQSTGPKQRQYNGIQV